MFTPVRVRGKKPRKKLYKAPQDHNMPTHTIAIRPQGHLKEHGSLGSNSASLDQLAMATPESTKKPSGLSSLELLPLEVLESIFLLSENVSLPMASAHIGTALASTHIRTKLVLQTFGSSTKYCFDHVTHHSYEVEEIPRNINLQSALLRQKWLSYTFFQHCQKTFMLRHAIKLHRADVPNSPRNIQASTIADMTNIIENTYDTDDRLRTQLRRDLPRPDPVPFDDDDHGFKWMASEGSCHFTWEDSSGSENFWELSCEGCTMSYGGDRYQFPHLPLSCEVPEKLLHGPWTNERGHFLMLLLTHGASINWIDSTAGEVAAKGLEDAIREDNEWAVRALVVYKEMPDDHISRGDPITYHFGDYPHGIFTDSEIKEMVAPHSKLRFSFDWCHQPSDRTSVGVVPTTKHLRIAVLEKSCDLRVLNALLVEAEKTTIDCDDPEIIDWALQKKAEAADESGGAKGRNVDKGTALLKALDDEREKQKRRLDSQASTGSG